MVKQNFWNLWLNTNNLPFFWVIRIIYSNNERSAKFLKKNAFLTFSCRYLKFNILEQFEFRIQSGKNNWCLYTYRKIWKICFLTFCNIHYTILSTAFSTLLVCTFTYKNYKASKITFLQRLYVLFYFSLFSALKVSLEKNELYVLINLVHKY